MKNNSLKINEEKFYPVFIKIFILLFLIITLSAVSICTESVSAELIEDYTGRKVELPENIDRITAVGPGALRIITYLGAEDLVVGIEEFEKRDQRRPYILANKELTELGVIGPQFGGDAELIAAAEVDLIFASYISEEELDKLAAKTKTAVISINDGTPGSMTEKELFKSLDLMAAVLNKEKEAEKIKKTFLNYKDDLKNRASLFLANGEDKTVYIGGIGNRGAKGITSSEAGYPPFEYLGLNNAFNLKGEKNFKVSREELLLKDPDIIFVDQGGLEIVKRELKRPEFKYLSAVENDNIYGLLPYNHYTTNFATMLADAYYIGEVVFGEDFTAGTPQAKADEIYKAFFGDGVYAEMAAVFGGFSKIKTD